MIAWLIVICGTLLQSVLLAAEPQPNREKSSGPSGNRYLFIVENSAAMEKRDQKLKQTIFSLVYGGIEGRMLTGDTFGVWTFNSEIDTRFPMQLWNASMRRDLAIRVNTLINNRGFQKKRSNVELLFQNLDAVIKTVGDVTVILLTDGDDRLSGTPFDREINGFYREMGPDLAASQEPFVTALVAQGGKFVAYAVARPGESLSLPPAPDRPRPKRSAPNPGAEGELTNLKPRLSTNRPPARRTEPIIITRDSSFPEPVVASAPERTNVVEKPTQTAATTPPEKEPAKLSEPERALAPIATDTFPMTNLISDADLATLPAPATKELDLSEAIPAILNTPLPIELPPPRPVAAPIAAQKPPPPDSNPLPERQNIQPDPVPAVAHTFPSSITTTPPSVSAPIPFQSLISSVPVHARETTNSSEITPLVTAVSMPSPPQSRTHGKLFTSLVLLGGAVGWGLISLYRARNVEQGSYISRAMPRSSGPKGPPFSS